MIIIPEHYSLKKGVALTAAAKIKVKKLADKYYDLTKKNIVITSGTRTSQSQAEAMYTKLSLGDKLTGYINQVAAKEIKASYDNAITAKKTKIQIIAAIKSTIDTQISKSSYISKHLKKGAVDVRSKDMSTIEKNHFKTAAKTTAKIVILEVKPPHFHLSL